MLLDKYILTLDFIKEHCNEVMGQWDGDKPGLDEERADMAREVLDYVQKIEEILKDL